MPVSVDVSIARRSVVKLAKALLLYQESSCQGDAFVTVHEVTGIAEGCPALAPGRLLTVEGLRELHKALYQQQRLEVLPPHVLAVSPERLAWWEPSRRRVMFFKTQDPYLNGLSGQPFPHPPLLFIAGERSLRVFALALDERPTGDATIYTAPYHNTDQRGVCLGSMPLLTSLSVYDTGAYSDAFFHSAFTHGTSERLLKGWGGSHGEVWRHAQERGAFPLEHLVPLDKSVEEAVNA